MIRVFHGDDRVKIEGEVRRVLGGDYEVISGEDLQSHEMVSLFLGVSLFAEKRKILVKDLGENSECFAELGKYLDTEHEVVIWEGKLDKRTATYKELAKQKVEVREFKLAEPPEKKLVFDIFEEAWRGNGVGAISLVEKIETTNDAYMFMGLMVSQALKKMSTGGKRAEKIIKLLAKCDMGMKSTGFEPWTLIKATLLEIAKRA